MAKQCAFVLMSWLFCIHVTTASAVTLQQRRMPKHLPMQRRNKLVAPSIIPKVAGNGPSNTPAQQAPAFPTISQDDAKKPRYIAEEIVMQRAWIYSAILPGWGQVYNKHYWKIPVIYGVFGGLAYGAIYYHRGYVKKKETLFQKEENNPNLIHYVDNLRLGRDLCIIFGVLWYVINIFDAYVGASLKTFTLSDDISLEVQPTMLSATHHLPTIGLNLTLRLQNENTFDRLWKDGSGH